MPCPRCGGCSTRLEIFTEEETLEAARCLNCGWMGGEALLDYHHRLETPPEPRRNLPTPIWDPERGQLKLIKRVHGREP